MLECATSLAGTSAAGVHSIGFACVISSSGSDNPQTFRLTHYL